MKRENQEMEPLLGALRAVRRRLRWQAALDGGARGAVLAGALAVPATMLARLDVVGGRGAVAATGAVLIVSVLRAVVRRLPLREVAARVDRTHGLADRLRSALELSSLVPRTALVQAAIDDGVRVARGVLVRRAAPLTRPRHLGTAVLLGLSALLVARFPARAVGGTGAVMGNLPSSAPASAERAEPRLRLEPERFEPEREAARELLREARSDGHGDAAGLARGLLALHAELARGGLSRREVLDRLDRLEREAAGKMDAAEAGGTLRQASERLSRGAVAEGLAASLARGDVKQARRQLESLEEGMSRPAGAREGRRIAAALDGKRAQPTEKQGARAGGAEGVLGELAEAVRRVEQVQRAQELVTETRELVRRGGHEEGREQRRAGGGSAAGGAQAATGKAGAASENGGASTESAGSAKGNAGSATGDAGSAATAMESKTSSAGSTTGAEAQAEGHAAGKSNGPVATGADGAGAVGSDVEKLRKAGQAVQAEGQGTGAARAGSGAAEREGHGDEKTAPPESEGSEGTARGRERGVRTISPANGDVWGGRAGGGDQGWGRADTSSPGTEGASTARGSDAAGALREFLARARGAAEKQGDEDSSTERGGTQSPVAERGGAGSQVGRRGDTAGGVAERGGEPAAVETALRGWGDAHDPNLFGAGTAQRARMRANEKMHAIHVAGSAAGAAAAGTEPGRADTILRSSERGFAGAHYRRVFRDYTAVTEEVLEREQTPPGYRYYVKRYFQLIRPRD